MIAWPTPRLLLTAVLLVALVAGAKSCMAPSSVEWGPGVVVAQEPLQQSSSRPDFSIQVDGKKVQVSPVAEFSVRARVLGVKRYKGRSLEDRLAPVDLALGWQNMSDESVLEHLSISQSRRWYFYKWRNDPPLPVGEMIRSSANMHMVPSTPQVAQDLKGVRQGDVVLIHGALVNLHADRWRWKSSTRRDDVGSGACELVWVEQVRIEPPP